MSELAQTVKVAIDAGEMFGSQEWSTYRRDIDRHGALNIGDGFGVIGVRIGDATALQLRIHEDAQGYVVLDIIDGRTAKQLAKVDVELSGLVPPRRGAKVTKERRFGD